ncbi:hypothetical protein [Pedobacter cryoconitis]|uniref:Uncharacterized protein n=1 Tax=Pedobacter cryoconitis TaxID=188932 RepID=A0A327SHD2_9SPHI|nr:hypothetical protein [Pedobacter cryoconitis]RAJ28108.1 hypothetical protein LY11_03428 [Pedobacter cryoconitis]
MEKLQDLKIELKGSDASAIRHGLKLAIDELNKYVNGSDRILASRLNVILKKNESLSDLLELAGSDVVDMRNGLYCAMKLLDENKNDDDTKLADQLEVIFEKVQMRSE